MNFAATKTRRPSLLYGGIKNGLKCRFYEIYQSGVFLLSLKKRLESSLSWQYLEYADN